MSLDCNNDPDLNDYDKTNMVVVLIEGSGAYNCYNRDEFNRIIKSEYEKGVCIQTGRSGKILSEPVFKEPYFNCFMDKSLIAFQHHDCVILYKRGNFPLRSQFGMSNIHGEAFDVYSVFPLSVEKFLNKPGSSKEFVDSVMASITPKTKEKLLYDVDFILEGGAINLIGDVYRKLKKNDGANIVDYVQVHAENLARAEEEEAIRLRSALSQNMAQALLNRPPRVIQEEESDEDIDEEVELWHRINMRSVETQGHAEEAPRSAEEAQRRTEEAQRRVEEAQQRLEEAQQRAQEDRRRAEEVRRIYAELTSLEAEKEELETEKNSITPRINDLIIILNQRRLPPRNELDELTREFHNLDQKIKNINRRLGEIETRIPNMLAEFMRLTE
jgi:hypothetical protein